MTGNVTANQLRAINCLLTGAKYVDVTKACTISERTLRRWLNDLAFAAAYHEARRDALHLATGRLQQASGSAVDTLVSLMGDVTVPPQVRANAAKTVLEIAYRASEHEDLEQRLVEIERTLNVQQEDGTQKTNSQWQ
jgi:hypothetical protein